MGMGASGMGVSEGSPQGGLLQVFSVDEGVFSSDCVWMRRVDCCRLVVARFLPFRANGAAGRFLGTENFVQFYYRISVRQKPECFWGTQIHVGTRR